MKVWISSETAVDKSDGDIDDILWKLYMEIEKQFNAYCKEIDYSNDGKIKTEKFKNGSH